MTSPQKADKACHNCRRKRLRCDRGYPYCHKCLTAGRECLGYGNLLRWTGAVASRGKLAGQTTPLPVGPAPGTPVFLGTAPSSPRYSPGLYSPEVRNIETSTSTSNFTSPSPSPPPESPHVETQLVRRDSSSDSAVAVDAATPWVLVDPLFQDLNPSYRYYLSYCMSLDPTCSARHG
jgi:hypothetical protein